MKNAIKNILIFVIMLAAVFNLQTQSAKAAWGDFDIGFGFQGPMVDTVTGHYPSAVAFQTDGKILVTGYRLVNGKKRIFLRRYLPSGQPDASFGSNGSAVSNALIVANADYSGGSIVVQPNGKIAVAGNGNGFPTVWRFNSNGSADGTFGSTGMRVYSNYPDSSPAKIAIQNSSLIVGVKKASGSSFGRAVVLRLNSNGTIDTTFGAAGEAVTGIVGNSFRIIAESETGKITVGGVRETSLGYFGFERLLSDGQSDPSLTFANVNVAFFPNWFIRLSNHKYILHQYTYPNGSFPWYYWLFKFTATGTQESVISYQFAVTDPPGNCASALAQQQDGKVIATLHGKLYRFDSELNSVVTEILTCPNLSQFTDKTLGALQTDDKMVVAGRYNGYLTLVRTLAN